MNSMILWSWGISCIPRPLHPSGTGDHDLGHTDRVRHRIDMVDETSFKHRYRRIPPSMYDEVRSHLKQLLDNAVIRPSSIQHSDKVCQWLATDRWFSSVLLFHPPIKLTATICVHPPIKLTATICVHPPIKLTATICVHPPIKLTATI
jgi:hypothetical protein